MTLDHASTMPAQHGEGGPSPWVVRWAARVRPGGAVLDVACGGGRHARFFAERGHPVSALDRDAEALAQLSACSGVVTTCADIEGGPWPFAEQRFDAVVVTHYLHRPLFPRLLGAVAAGGVLIYETFALGNERYGRPSNPDFLLRPGELLNAVHGQLSVMAYEDITSTAPRMARLQRICAVRATIDV